MSDKRDSTDKGTGGPSPAEEAPHKVDQTVQEEAAKDRTENEGYD